MDEFSCIVAILIGLAGLAAAIASGDESFLLMSLLPLGLGVSVLILDKRDRKKKINEIRQKARRNEESYISNGPHSGLQRSKGVDPEDVRERLAGVRVPDEFRTLLTSQLTALWLKTNDEKYRKEFFRRIKMCGVTDETAQKWLDFETGILRRCPRPEMCSDDFIRKPLFSMEEKFLPEDIGYYESHFDYPLSYVIRISDEAEWHFRNSHEKDLPDPVRAEIYDLSDQNRKLFVPLAIHMTEALGWDFRSVNVYSFNEQGMLDLIRWEYKSTQAASMPWGMKVR